MHTRRRLQFCKIAKGLLECVFTEERASNQTALPCILVYFVLVACQNLLACHRKEAVSPLSVSHVLQGLAVASRQASGSKASLRVAGYQIGLRHTQLWPRGLYSSRRMTLKLPRAIFKCNSQWLCVCVSTVSVCLCMTFNPPPAGIQGPFQIRNGAGGGVGRFSSEPAGFPRQGLRNIRNICHSETRLNITATVINHTACVAHDPPATGYTFWVLLQRNQEYDRTERNRALRFNICCV